MLDVQWDSSADMEGWGGLGFGAADGSLGWRSDTGCGKIFEGPWESTRALVQLSQSYSGRSSAVPSFWLGLRKKYLSSIPEVDPACYAQVWTGELQVPSIRGG